MGDILVRVKRTNLRSNPEDAEHFRRHRESVHQRLWAGEQPETIATALAAEGVPLETARRIVVAVRYELGVSEFKSETSWKSVWWTAGLMGPFVLVMVAYYAWRLDLRDVGIPAIALFALVCVISLFFRAQRRRNKDDGG
jgi:hypothetical protein